ncbi:MAG: hypothetical protein POELPBGB_02215 [Bacteroidia bacterium]|nr:hypothetical protein [Bacteroidia bacterium]
MPANKNAYGRYLAIDDKLKTGRKFTWEQLADACELSSMVRARPSESTIKHDIIELRNSFNAPIPKAKDGQYYYEDKTFSIVNSPITDEDVDKLNEALVILKQFQSLPQFQGIEEFILKLESKTGKKGKKTPNVIEFESQYNLKGIEYLSNLYRFILDERAIFIDYQKFSENKPTELLVHPYFLKEYNNRWFLFGFNETYSLTEIFALDRMIFIRSSGKPFIANESINFENYFSDFIGVSKTIKEEKEKILLAFNPQRANYVKTKLLHHSQRIVKETKTKCLIEIEVIPNPELKAKILEFGSDVVVLKPEKLAAEIQLILKDAVSNYK